MDLDLLSLQAVIVGGALLLFIVLRNGWRERVRRRRAGQVREAVPVSKGLESSTN